MATSKSGKAAGKITTVVGRQEITRHIAAQAGLTQKKSAEVLDIILGSIQDSLKQGHEVRLVGFGSFKVRQSAARKGVNPRSGQPLQVAAKDRVRFSPGKELSDAVLFGAPRGIAYEPIAGELTKGPPGLPDPTRSTGRIQTCRCPRSGCHYAIQWKVQFAGDRPPQCYYHRIDLICT